MNSSDIQAAKEVLLKYKKEMMKVGCAVGDIVEIGSKCGCVVLYVVGTNYLGVLRNCSKHELPDEFFVKEIDNLGNIKRISAQEFGG